MAVEPERADRAVEQSTTGAPVARGAVLCDAALGLFAGTSTWLMYVAFILTLMAKGVSGGALRDGLPLGSLLAIGWRDALVFFGLAAGFAWLEALVPSARRATAAISGALFLLASSSALFLLIAGEQGSWEAALDLSERFKDARMIVEEMLTFDVGVALAGGVLLLFGTPVAVQLWMRRRAPGVSFGRRRLAARAWIATFLVAPSVCIALVVSEPERLEERKLSRNGLWTLARTALRSQPAGTFVGWGPAQAVAGVEIERFATSPRKPNVIFVVLESTRFDYTSLAGHGAKASTPALAALAERGLSARQMRSVVPHTTKSLFVIFCGRWPTLQRRLTEITQGVDAQCLPRILGEAGYRTAFYQSAPGIFESRPRLVDALGFEEFKAWEDIGGKRLGYLGSEDDSMLPFVAEFLDREEGEGGRPFMLALLTSATHHPYRLSKRVRESAKQRGLPAFADFQRYARNVEEQDHMLASLLAELRRRGLEEETLLVVVADHGEGFGAHGIRQHDDNFYEEGLLVPFVVSGPGIPQRRIERNASLVDVTPTLLGRLGIEADARALDGIDLLDETRSADPRPVYFSCHRETSCRGFVLGDTKVVYEPQTGEAWAFDLSESPDERVALPLNAALRERLPALDALARARRTAKWDWSYEALESLLPWRCAEGEVRCRHPRARNPEFRY